MDTLEVIRISEQLHKVYTTQEELLDDLDEMMHLMHHINRDLVVDNAIQNVAFLIRTIKRIILEKEDA